MKRVCHITTIHPIGDPRIFHKECASLRDAGYEVTLIGPYPKNCVIDRIRVIGVNSSRNRLERFLRNPVAVYLAARATGADLYHFHDPDFLPFAALLARRGARVIYDAHEDLATQMEHKDWIPRRMRTPVGRAASTVEAACLPRIDAVVTVNETIAQRLRQHQPRTVVVANYPLRTEISPAKHWSDRERAAGYIGSITTARGAHALVQAMDQIDASLYLGGNVSDPSLLAELKRCSGWQRVRYLGQIDRQQVRDVLARVKVGVIPLHPTPQYSSAYPVKLFEYMAAAIPVVATDMPHLRKFIENHGCGICVPHNSPQRLAAAICELLNDDARAQAMGERGRRVIEQMYSWESEADTLLRLYSELLGDRISICSLDRKK